MSGLEAKKPLQAHDLLGSIFLNFRGPIGILAYRSCISPYGDPHQFKNDAAQAFCEIGIHVHY